MKHNRTWSNDPQYDEDCCEEYECDRDMIDYDQMAEDREVARERQYEYYRRNM